MTATARDLDQLIGDIRAAFRTLRRVGDALHAERGPTTAMRALMEYLAQHGPTSVPDLARAKSVSRQSVQTQVDALGNFDWVDLLPNPAHRRSSLVTLTDSGRALFEAMRADEAAVLEALAADFSQDDIACARRVLTQLAARLDELPPQPEAQP